MKDFLSILLISFTVQINNAQTDTIDYFGQTSPGDSAVIFAPGIISLPGRNEINITFSPDGSEVYYSAVNSDGSDEGVYYKKRVNKTWTEQVKEPIFDGFRFPRFSAGGNKLYFTKYNNDNTVSHIWGSERTTGGWSSPQILAAPVNSTASDAGYTETADSIIYISSTRPGGFGNGDIWCIRPMSGQAENLGSFVNSAAGDYDPCIARDGSYLIFGSERPGGYGNQDLYVSFKKGNQGWTKPVNMEACGAGINLAQYSAIEPSLSPDGKYLFFNRHNWTGVTPDIYWVSTNVIDKLKKIVFAPKLSRQIPDINIKTDSALNYIIPENTFSCEYGVETLKYEAALSNGSPLPLWPNFDPETRRLWGAPTQAGTDTIKITATNIDTVSASCTFRITVTDLTGIEEDNNHLPHELKLSQNYPNPFNPSTVISYHLSAFSNVKLTIYNVLGQKIKTLVNSFQSVGEHSIVWDATDEKNNPVSSGMYFYSLSTSERSVQKKMLLVR